MRGNEPDGKEPERTEDKGENEEDVSRATGSDAGRENKDSGASLATPSNVSIKKEGEERWWEWIYYECI